MKPFVVRSHIWRIAASRVSYGRSMDVASRTHPIRLCRSARLGALLGDLVCQPIPIRPYLDQACSTSTSYAASTSPRSQTRTPQRQQAMTAPDRLHTHRPWGLGRRLLTKGSSTLVEGVGDALGGTRSRGAR
ncbi:hypothetical protein G5V59_02650 [Nocardioides sp. W3-2-3]|uniref:hypothetical protein n=1 Tax=Nocardioides convexus TaxID=2712224 RepID=UPI002418448D|nr:hypothetical protein [Nocardioides convexus]NGZ99652.1 hypothetical protein [Nocardioides convexus]